MIVSNEYHFITRWCVRASVEEVVAIMSDATDLPRWWPSVYLAVEQIRPGDANGLGAELSLYTKGWLPYTLRWDFRVVDVRSDTVTLEAYGDFAGHGAWTIEQDGPYVSLIYDWKVRAEKPLLRYLSFLMKPIFAANHRWAMARGEESLRIELARRRARTPEEQANVPKPPEPTTTSSAPLLIGTAACAGLLYLATRRLRRR